MKFISNLKLLKEAADNVSLAVNPKSTGITALDGILMECKDNKLKLKGYDLELAIVRTIDVDCQEEGSAIIDSTVFCGMLSKMEGPDVEINCNSRNMFTVADNTTNYKIMGIDKEEYPDLPETEEEFSFTVNGGVLNDMISKTIFASAGDAAQTPVLCGCMFSIANKTLNVIAVDGYRVAIVKEKVETDAEESFIVPSKTLKEICKLIGDQNDDVKISVGKHHAFFKVLNYSVITRLLEGDFIDYKSAIPKQSKTMITINPKDLLRTIERVSVIESTNVCVIMHVDKNDSIELETESAIGSSKERVESQIDGEGLGTIAFNGRYMTDALRKADGDIKIILNSSISPIEIIPKTGDGYLYLVLPVRLKSQL